MSNIAWPAGVPSTMETWAESDVDVLIRTAAEAGPAKVRRRYTGVVSTVDCGITLTLAQWAILRTWWRVDLQQGALPFAMPDPSAGGAERGFRFAEPPAVSDAGPLAVGVSLKLERRGG